MVWLTFEMKINLIKNHTSCHIYSINVDLVQSLCSTDSGVGAGVPATALSSTSPAGQTLAAVLSENGTGYQIGLLETRFRSLVPLIARLIFGAAVKMLKAPHVAAARLFQDTLELWRTLQNIGEASGSPGQQQWRQRRKRQSWYCVGQNLFRHLWT